MLVNDAVNEFRAAKQLGLAGRYSGDVGIKMAFLERRALSVPMEAAVSEMNERFASKDTMVVKQANFKSAFKVQGEPIESTLVNKSKELFAEYVDDEFGADIPFFGESEETLKPRDEHVAYIRGVIKDAYFRIQDKDAAIDYAKNMIETTFGISELNGKKEVTMFPMDKISPEIKPWWDNQKKALESKLGVEVEIDADVFTVTDGAYSVYKMVNGQRIPTHLRLKSPLTQEVVDKYWENKRKFYDDEHVKDLEELEQSRNISTAEMLGGGR